MSSPSWLYWQKMIHKLAMFVLVLGGLNWGLVGVTKINLVEKLFGRFGLTKAVYILVGLAALSVAFSRDFYLPFLGETHVPCGAIKEKTPEGATVALPIRVNPGQKVLFWASEPSTEKYGLIHSWDEAYLGWENAGVTVADEKGLAVLRVRTPQPYTVPIKGKIESHIHYRVCMGNGMLGRVETAYLDQAAANEIKENFLYRYG